MSDASEELGRRLRVMRLGRGMGMNDAARRLGLSRSYLHVIESGKTMPGLDYLIRLVKFYGGRLEEVVSGIQELAPQAIPDDPLQPLLPGFETRKDE